MDNLYDLIVEIRDILKALYTAVTGLTTPSEGEIEFGIDPRDFVYERRASTLEKPVPANAKNYPLIDWNEPERTGRVFYLCAIGSDQHDNSYYHWIVDEVELPVSGEARVGGIYDPLVFPKPIKVRKGIKLLIDNNNSVPYPNDGSEPSDPIPYEGVFIGFWGR